MSVTSPWQMRHAVSATPIGDRQDVWVICARAQAMHCQRLTERNSPGSRVVDLAESFSAAPVSRGGSVLAVSSWLGPAEAGAGKPAVGDSTSS